jgi:threonine dehydrogenase-like Zn-dependent dehydrogenase
MTVHGSIEFTIIERSEERVVAEMPILAGIKNPFGPGVPGWELGQRVGVGWNGGYCGYCDYCRRGAFFACGRG